MRANGSPIVTRNIEIDALRGVAVLLVLVAHLGYLAPHGSPLVAAINRDVAQFWVGVDLFFVISGYVISAGLLPILDGAQDRLQRIRTIGGFYRRRFWRIVPTALVWVFVAVLLAVVASALGLAAHRLGQVDVVLRNALSVIAFAQNFYILIEPSNILSQYWSLAIEEQFYLLFPLFLLLFNGRTRAVALLVLIALQAPLLRPPRQDFFWSMVRYDALAMGVLVYLWRDALRGMFAGPVSRLWPSIRALLMLGLLALACYLPPRIGHWSGGMTAIDLVCASIVLLAILDVKILQAGLPRIGFSVLHFLGKRSYSLYLAHKPVFFVVATALLQLEGAGIKGRTHDLELLPVLSGFAVAILCAELSYRVIEGPTAARGRNNAMIGA